ncbi:MAG: hypothetical protein M1825_005502 [Sarcosagium campestre]|nr:MAG: hypothetical protein M1825_005502 [Sarcosagium campestre]
MSRRPFDKVSSPSAISSPWSGGREGSGGADQSRAARQSSDSEAGHYHEGLIRPGSATDQGMNSPMRQLTGQDREGMSKMNQIIQNYFIKAALIIVQSRMRCPPAYNRSTGAQRVNKWFNVEIDETDLFREDWRTWKNCDSEGNRPPRMIIEAYLDMAHLTRSQSLVIIDDQGKRWNVDEAMSASGSERMGRSNRQKNTKVILERWTVELGAPPIEQPTDLNTILPAVYKKSIVLFRSLYTYSKFLPTWKFAKRLEKQSLSHNALRVHCRIFPAYRTDESKRTDTLKIPLFQESGPSTEEFSFGATESPAGPFSVKVCYRTSCEFRVDDSEALLSSHFMGVDDGFFRPSLDAQDDVRSQQAGMKEVGSLPTERIDAMDSPDRSQAYGSLSTFHQVGPPTGSSPISALRAARDLGQDSASSSPPAPNQLRARSGESPISKLRSDAGGAPSPRRPSVSFMPFKSPSLSASPSQGGHVSSHRSSVGRAPTGITAAQARSRNSIEPQSPSALRDISASPDSTKAPSASPKPASVARYSSSFGHRRGRLSSGASKMEDDNNSSGRGSQASSSAQPGSGMLAEGTAGASSGSVQTDDENISDFLKMLDMKKSLKSFESPGNAAEVDASSKRTSAALSKFQRMRDSNAALSDSLSSSLLLQRSSSSSSRQLSSVPPMVGGTSMSPSSSPGKPISPHTPHTPAVPSRLSSNSIAEYTQPRRERLDNRSRTPRAPRASREDEDPEETRHGELGTNAIDIPTSPTPYLPHIRRASSVAQQHRALQVEEETGELLPYGIRSASLGAEDRPPLSLSELLRLQDTSDAALPPSDAVDGALELPPRRENTSLPMSRQPSSSLESRDDGLQNRRRQSGTAAASYRPRLGATGGRRATPPQGSFSSYGGGDRGSGSASSDRPANAGGRYSFTRPANFDEEEPLLFAMSEIGGHQSRRSLEEARGGSSTAGSGDRGGLTDNPSSSRRGSRRPGQWGRY